MWICEYEKKKEETVQYNMKLICEVLLHSLCEKDISLRLVKERMIEFCLTYRHIMKMSVMKETFQIHDKIKPDAELPIAIYGWFLATCFGTWGIHISTHTAHVHMVHWWGTNIGTSR